MDAWASGVILLSCYTAAGGDADLETLNTW